MPTNTYSRLEHILPTAAAIKLYALVQGVDADGEALQQQILGYPEAYRTKRQKRRTGLVDGKLYDTLDQRVPWIPEEVMLQFPDGSCSVVKVNYRESSDVHIHADSAGGKLTLESRDGAFCIPCSLVERRREDTGGCLEVLGADRISMLGYEGCSGWMKSLQCKFCDSAARRKEDAGPIPTLNDLTSLAPQHVQAWMDNAHETFLPKLAKAYGAVVDNVSPHRHVHVMSGNLPDLDMTWRYHVAMGRALDAVKPLSEVDSYLNLLPPENPSLLEEAKDVGFRKVIFNMEVWGEADYQAVCPEKAQLMPMQCFMQRIEEALVVFGHGNVNCGFVLGAQPVDILHQGIETLSRKGVSCSFTVFTPKQGTPWANRSKPDLLTVAESSRYLCDCMRKNKLEPFYCRQSSRSEVLWEILANGEHA